MPEDHFEAEQIHSAPPTSGAHLDCTARIHLILHNTAFPDTTEEITYVICEILLNMAEVSRTLRGSLPFRQPVNTPFEADSGLTYTSSEIQDLLETTINANAILDAFRKRGRLAIYTDDGRERRDEQIALAQNTVNIILLLVFSTELEMNLKRDSRLVTDERSPKKYMYTSLFLDDSARARRYEEGLKETMLELAKAIMSLESQDIPKKPNRDTAFRAVARYPRRTRSTDTMSTLSMPSPPYGLVDWSETKKLREMMG